MGRVKSVSFSLLIVSVHTRRAGSVNVLQRVCFPPSRLRALVSRRDGALSQRSVMNNAGHDLLIGLGMECPHIFQNNKQMQGVSR
jgi:hypothetical protein